MLTGNKILKNLPHKNRVLFIIPTLYKVYFVHSLSTSLITTTKLYIHATNNIITF